MIIRIIGNSYFPKIVKAAPGTSIKWINEDVFTYMEGKIIVSSDHIIHPQEVTQVSRAGAAPGWLMISLTLLALIIALIALINK